MKQTLQEYVEGRLALGGCVLKVIVAILIIGGIIIGINEFFSDFLDNWLLYAVVGGLLLLVFLIVYWLTPADK